MAASSYEVTRCRRQRADATRSAKASSTGPMGARASTTARQWAVQSSRRSPGTTSRALVRPWVSALQATRALPAFVLGPRRCGRCDRTTRSAPQEPGEGDVASASHRDTCCDADSGTCWEELLVERLPSGTIHASFSALVLLWHSGLLDSSFDQCTTVFSEASPPCHSRKMWSRILMRPPKTCRRLPVALRVSPRETGSLPKLGRPA